MAGRNVIIRGDELYHFGIKGQKWGVRRYQNEDGTLTEEGKKRYMYEGSGSVKKRGLLYFEQQRIKDAVRNTNEKDAETEVNNLYANKNKEDQESGLELLSVYVKNNPRHFWDNTLQEQMVRRINNDFDTRELTRRLANEDTTVKVSKTSQNAIRDLFKAYTKTREYRSKLYSGEANIEQYVDSIVDQVNAQNKFIYARMNDLGISKTTANLDSIRWIIGANDNN